LSTSNVVLMTLRSAHL